MVKDTRKTGRNPSTRHAKKALFVATVDSHILAFHLPYLKMLQEMGYETHVATNGHEVIPYCNHRHTICMERSPFRVNNLRAIKQMRGLLAKEHFDIIHCHTPMGGVVTRLAAKQTREQGTRVIYTAHGFHFYDGAPLVNWLLFYPVEKYLAKYTDTLITINQEDYNRAKQKFSSRCHDIQYVPGVGLDTSKFDFKMTEKEKLQLRESLGLKKDDFVIIYPAELSKRKRQIWLINTLNDFLKQHPDVHLLLPGKDSLHGACQALCAKLQLDGQVHCIGFRDDIPKLLKISNMAVSSAKQEGLPVNIMEAMYVGLPIVASDCRGVKDLLKNTTNSYLVDILDGDGFERCVTKIYELRGGYPDKTSENKTITQKYALLEVEKIMHDIYSNGEEH